MHDFKDEYVDQVMRGMKEIGNQLFPPDAEIAFGQRAQKQIEAGENLCAICDQLTTEMAWPQGAWLCSKHAQALWNRGHVRLIMNMESNAEERQNWLAEQQARKTNA